MFKKIDGVEMEFTDEADKWGYYPAGIPVDLAFCQGKWCWGASVGDNTEQLYRAAQNARHRHDFLPCYVLVSLDLENWANSVSHGIEKGGDDYRWGGRYLQVEVAGYLPENTWFLTGPDDFEGKSRQVEEDLSAYRYRKENPRPRLSWLALLLPNGDLGMHPLGVIFTFLGMVLVVTLIWGMIGSWW